MEKKVVLETKNLKIIINGKGSTIDYGNLQIFEGEFINIVGSNGIGKSTFLKVILNQAGYCSIKEGTAILNGKDIFSEYSFEEIQRTIVDISQEENFKTYESTYKALIRPALVAAPDKKKEIINNAFYFYKMYLYSFFNDNHTISKDKIEKLRNNPKLDRQFMHLKRASSLSGGQQKIVHILQGIIKAKVNKSPIILMDEPLNNLDKANKKLLIKLINELREYNPSVVILTITHCKVFSGVRGILSIQEKDNNAVALIERYDEDIKSYDCLV